MKKYIYDNYKKSELKRYTVTEWIDIDTGLILSKHEKERNYIIKSSEESYENKTLKNGTKVIVKTIRRICQHKGQLNIEF